MADGQTLRFEIDGMTCASCVGRAEKAIAGVPGVTNAQVNLADKTGRLKVTDGAVMRDVAEALQTAGYPAHSETRKLTIEGMTCASCIGRVEAALLGVPGVITATANLADGTAIVQTVIADDAPLIEAVAGIGYEATPISGESISPVDRQAAEAALMWRRFLIAAVLTIPVFSLEMGGHVFPAFHHLIARTIGTPTSWGIQFVLTTLVLIWPGRMFFTKGVPALLRWAPDMNALVVLGAGAAWTYSTVVLFAPGWLPDSARAVYFEAAAVIVTLILLGRWLEARAKGRTGAAIERLIGLRPDQATVVRNGQAVTVAVADVILGDLVQIKPGGRIPVDGTVHAGHSFVDEAMLTGEPLAVEKQLSDKVTGGTVNGEGMLEVTATAVGSDTALARIIEMVSAAQGARLPVQDMVNRITMWFVPAVLAVALVTVVVWLFIGTLPQALVAGVSVLIIACPCAMGLAVPVAIMVGTGRAAELGVLFRQGDALQALQDVDWVAFDKTGTLTLGETRLAGIEALDGDTDLLLAQVAAVEATSEHPLAHAIVAAAKGQKLPKVSAFKAIPGHGLSANVDGVPILIGAARLLTREGVDPAPLIDLADAQAAAGRTPVLVARNGQAAGVLAVSDTLRPEAKAAIAALHAAGLKTAMITGDTTATAQAVANTLGIDHVSAEVLPEGKVETLKLLPGKVAFVGDGINDAPALAAASVGIAIGTGTDVAVDSADVVLMAGDPGGVARAVTLSRATMRNIRQNLAWAFGYNTLLIPVAAFGLLSPGLAAGAMAMSSVLVVLNALRLRRVA